METRDGYGLLIDPNTIPRDEVSSERASLLDAWIDAESALKSAAAACDEAALRLQMVQEDRNEFVRNYGRKFSRNFMDDWRDMKAIGRPR